MAALVTRQITTKLSGPSGQQDASTAVTSKGVATVRCHSAASSPSPTRSEPEVVDDHSEQRRDMTTARSWRRSAHRPGFRERSRSPRKDGRKWKQEMGRVSHRRNTSIENINRRWRWTKARGLPNSSLQRKPPGELSSEA